MDVAWRLTLPCEVASVRSARKLLRAALESADVDPETGFDICLALAEACANVVEHAGDGAGYTVVVRIDERLCRVDVIDSGVGFDLDLCRPRAADTAESGRGIDIMRQLMDLVRYDRAPAGGAWVRFEKALRAERREPSLAMAG